MGFKRITINGWQQFRKIDLQFHDRLTILTGANGSGKTTILRFLARHFGWDFQYLRTPYKNRVTGFNYLISFLRGPDKFNIGTIEYDSGRKTNIRLPPEEQSQQAIYNLSIETPEQTSGFFIP
jgi:energy-coupling factor transporter ATP-binding protein EcfA2